EWQLEMATARARYRSIFLFVVQQQRWGATNRAPAAAVRHTRTAAAGLRKSWGAVASDCHSERSRGMERVGRATWTDMPRGSGERVGRRTRSISNYFEISIPLRAGDSTRHDKL